MSPLANNPLARNINSAISKPAIKPKTPAEVAAEMLKQKQATMTAKTGEPMPQPAPTPTPSPQWSPPPSGPNDWINPLYEGAQQGGLPQGATVVNGNGQVATVGGPTPKPANPLATTANIAAPVVAGYGVNSVLGGSSSAGSAVPAAPSVIGAGTGAPAAPEILYAGPNTTSDAALLGSNITGGLEYLGVGPETAGMVGSGLGTALPVAGGALGAYGLYNNLTDNQKDPLGGAASGAALGASVGSFFPGVGTLVGAGVGALAGGAAGMTGGDKGKDQLGRDQVRAGLKDAGVIDDKYNLTLADGSKFDIGADGSIQNYNVDFEKDGVGNIVAAANPLAALITAGNPKLRSDFAGYFANAAMSSGDTLENIKKFYADAGFDHAKAYAGINKLVEDGSLDRAEADAYLNGLDQLFGVGAYGKGEGEKSEAKPRSGGGSSKPKPTPEAPTPIAPGTPPTYGEPSGTAPVSVQDYVAAIDAVNAANQSSESQTDAILKLMKMKNPLFGGI